MGQSSSVSWRVVEGLPTVQAGEMTYVLPPHPAQQPLVLDETSVKVMFLAEGRAVEEIAAELTGTDLDMAAQALPAVRAFVLDLAARGVVVSDTPTGDDVTV